MLGSNKKQQNTLRSIKNSPSGFWQSLSACLLVGATIVSGCTQKPAPVEASAPVASATEQMSEEAQKLYYYLALSDALSSNDSAYLAKIISGLGRLDPSPELFQESSNILLRQKSPTLAAEIARQGLETYPADEFLNLMLARGLEDSGKTPKAIEVLAGFINQYGPTQDSLAEIIRMLINTRRIAEAEQYLKKLPADSSNKALFLHIHINNQTENYAASKALAQQYIKKYPKDIDGYLALGDVSEYQKDFPQAIAAFEKALSLDPANQELAQRLMSLYILGGKPKKALQLAMDQPMPPKAAVQLVYMFADLGQPELAKELLINKVTGLGLDERQLYFATILLRSNAPLEQVLAELDKIDQSSTMHFDAQEFRIQILLRYEEYDQAIKEGSQLLSKLPENPNAWALQALVLRKSGRHDEARNLLLEAKNKFPKDIEFIFSLAMLEEDLGNSEKAMKLMEQVLKIDPRHAPSLNNIGYTLAVQGKDLERALSLLKTAIEEDPYNVYYKDSIAWILFKMGRYQEAWQNIQTCLEYGFSEAVIWEHYGDIAAAMNLWEDAEVGYTEALKGQPKNSEEISKKLQNVQQHLKK